MAKSGLTVVNHRQKYGKIYRDPLPPDDNVTNKTKRRYTQILIVLYLPLLSRIKEPRFKNGTIFINLNPSI
jgi:hypothetical protein